MKEITIGVIFFNEQANLPRLLKSFETQIKEPISASFSFLFIDNSSTDHSKAIVENWMASNPQFSSQLIARQKNHLSEARQQAAEQCQTHWLVYVDADTELDWGWAQGILTTYKDLAGKATGIGGKSYFVPTQSWHKWVVPLAEIFPLGRSKEIIEVDHVPTNNYLVNVKQVLEVGGFNQKFFNVGEDLDLNIRLRNKGPIYYSENFSVKHFLPANQTQWFQKMFRYGWAQSFVAMKNRGGISPLKALPFLFLIILGVSLFYQTFVVGLILICSLFFPRLRFYFLSFLFYGIGETYGGLDYMFKAPLKGRSSVPST